jgi:flagellar hook-basal body protein
MGLFGSLFTGVSALFAQSQNTAIISNNIANINTTGFKRSEASFQSLVTTESRLARYSPGTVSVNRLQRVDQQGALQQTSSATDASISGNGFFPVRRGTDLSQPFLYTRNGQFSEDAQGLLRNSAGFVLYAWPIDANGALPANQGDLTSLVQADVAFLGGLTRPTSSAELAINLDATELDNILADAITGGPDFTRGLTVYDSLGSAQPIIFEFSKVYGPHGSAASLIGENTATTELVNDLGLSIGDTFSIDTELGAPVNFVVTATSTIGDVINAANAIAGVNAFLGNNGELVIQRDDFLGGAANILTLADVVGTPLAGLGLTAGAYASDDLSGATYDNGLVGDSPSYSSEGFPAFQNLPGDVTYNDRGWWQVEIIHPDGSIMTRGLVNFNGDGTINALDDPEGNVDIELNNIDWGNGSNPQSLEIDVERFSQFAGNYDVIFSDQNGAELGLRTGVEITREGVVVARFSNGASADLYQIPLITFANEGGLTEVSGTAYSESEESGEENLREAGTGGAGFVEPSTLEASNVDLADEFAKLIVSQRAFGAATKVITTVDQMTEDLLRLR